ncbi:MAG: UrcA family protein [Chakrabartia godavariana]
MFSATKMTTAALALALLAPVSAMAETMSVPVRYGDLDLSTTQGQRSFERRIAAASRMICGSLDRERDVARRGSITKCLAEVRQSAEPARIAAIAVKTRALS